MAGIDMLKKRVAQGNNDLDAQELYEEKKYFYDEVFPLQKSEWFENPIDFVNENPLYGKIDLNKDYVFPKTIKMKDLDGVRAFDFVVDAFLDLQSFLAKHVEAGWLSADGPIARLTARKGYVELDEIFNWHYELHYFTFVGLYTKRPPGTGLSQGSVKDSIKNVSDFIKHFANYLKEAVNTVPLTKTAVGNRKLVSPLSTGLCIEIYDKDYDDDREKHMFMKDPNFNFYRIAARKYGFMVDRNVPWRLVADVSSEYMREYMRMANERDIIEIRKKDILEASEAALKSKFSDMPSIEEIMSGTVGLPDIVWNKEDVDAFRADVKAQLRQAKQHIKNMYSETWTTAMVVGPIDPEADITGKKICETLGKITRCKTRVMTLDAFFKEYYYVPYINDLSVLSMRLYQFYKSYMLQYPTIFVTKDGCTEEIELSDMSASEFQEKFGDKFWLKFYFDVRLAESKVHLSKKDYNKKIKKLFQLASMHDRRHSNSVTDFFKEKILDFERALMYINKETKEGHLDASKIYRKSSYATNMETQIALMMLNSTKILLSVTDLHVKKII
tara:strand:+ start:4688 stop:6358 length:1671 start_codon:yes stop_codon:yes gene_type:complete